MRNLQTFLLVFFLGSFFTACNFTHATGLKNASSKPIRVILEMDSSTDGSMDSLNGRILAFRLYENGQFEYEEFSEEKQEKLDAQSFSSEAVVKKYGQMPAETLTEIKEILANKDFQKVDDFYKNAEGFCTCGASRLEIRYKNGGGIQNINIDGAACADLNNPDPKMFPNFPKSISALIEKVKSVKRS